MSSRAWHCLGLVSVFVSACVDVPSVDHAVARADSMGVEIVTAHTSSSMLPWTLKERWRLSHDEGGPELTTLSSWTVAATASGSLYVLDESAYHVLLVDAIGHVVGTMGKHGGGPGELQRPGGIAVAQDGVVWVYDYGKRGFVRFGPDGRALPERPTDFPMWGGIVRPADDGVFVEKYSSTSPASVTRSVLQVANDRTATVAAEVLPAPRMVEVPGCNVSIPIGRIFEPTLQWDGRGSTVVVFVGPAYVVDVYAAGSKRRSLRRDMELREVDEEMAIAQYADGFQVGLMGGTCSASGPAMVRAQGFAAHLPAVSQLAVGPEGEIWVQQGHVTGEDPPIDVWSREGEFIGTLPAGTPFPIAFLPGHRIAVAETDAFDVPTLVVYDVDRDAPGGPLPN